MQKIKAFIFGSKNAILVFIAIIIMIFTAYQLKLLGIAVTEEDESIAIAETIDTETAQTVETADPVEPIIPETVDEPKVEEPEIKEPIVEEPSAEPETEVPVTENVVGTENTISEEIKSEENVIDIKENTIKNEIVEDEKISIANTTKDENNTSEQNIVDEELIEIPTEIVFNNNEYKVTVSAIAEGALKDVKEVRVTPITAEANPAEYNNISEKLENKVEEENAINNEVKELAGFLAYDIKLVDTLGNEKEPDGNVNISFEFLNIPEKVSKHSEAEVSIIHFEENHVGDVNLVEYVKEQPNVNIETNSENEVVKFDIETNSFSVFVINWKVNNTTVPFQFATHYINTNGKTIENNEYVSEVVNTTSGTINFNSNTYIKPINGYTYNQKIYIEYNGTRYDANSVTISSRNGTYSLRVGNTTIATTTSSTIYVDVYYEYKVTGTLIIEDKMVSEGYLCALFNNEVEDLSLPEKANVKYVWERSLDNGGTWTEVTERKVVGDLYNISGNGTKLNVALDLKGETLTNYPMYRVTRYIENEQEPNSVPVTTVNFYNELKNGNFANPKITGSDYQPYITSGEDGIVWKTTAVTQDIELISTNSKYGNAASSYHGINYTEDADEQYAEINGNGEGALYQDMLSIPGTTMYWELLHNARRQAGKSGGTDTMYVVISATQDACNLTQSELNSITARFSGSDRTSNIVTYNGKQYYVFKISDTVASSSRNDKWHDANGTYVVPEGQYVTRYFFVSGNTSSGDKTVGNHIDKIWFSPNIPEPNPDKINVTITKTIAGSSLTDTEKKEIANNITFKVESQVTQLNNINLNTADYPMSWSYDENENYIGTYTFINVNIPANTNLNVKVTENITPNSNIDSKYELTQNAYFDNNSNDKSNTNSLTGTFTRGTSKVFNFVNTYSSKVRDVSFTKVNETGDVLGGVSFKLTNNETEYTATSNVNGVVEFKDIPMGTYTLVETQTLQYYVCPENKTYTVNATADGVTITENGLTNADGEIHYLTNNNGYKITNFEKLTQIVINKQSALGNKLNGVEFRCYETENPTKVVTLTTNSEGKVIFENIRYGVEYTIEESKPLDNYYGLDSTIKLTASLDNNNKTQFNVVAGDSISDRVTKTADGNELNVINIKHTEMPKAGGMGVYVFYIVGAIMMISTILIYRKNNKKIY